MLNIESSSTGGKSGINICLLTWWFKKVPLKDFAEEIFDQIPDEYFSSISDVEVGKAALKIKDFWMEFLIDVENDPFASFAFHAFGNIEELKRWMAIEIGSSIKKLPGWEGRLPAIRAAQRRLHQISRVLNG